MQRPRPYGTLRRTTDVERQWEINFSKVALSAVRGTSLEP